MQGHRVEPFCYYFLYFKFKSIYLTLSNHFNRIMLVEVRPLKAWAAPPPASTKKEAVPLVVLDVMMPACTGVGVAMLQNIWLTLTAIGARATLIRNKDYQYL